MDKENIIQLILLEDKDKKYKLQNLLYKIKTDLLVILFSLNTKYYRKSYKFSIDNWYKLIISNEFYFDKCPNEIKNKFTHFSHYKIIEKYPNTRFFYYDSIENIYFKNKYLSYILSKYPEYKNEIEEKFKIDIFKSFKREAWIILINNNPTYYYDKCPEEYLSNRHFDWKKIIIYDIKFLEIFKNNKYILSIDDWYWILTKHITNIKEIPKIVLSSLVKYQWSDIIKQNPSIIKMKKYNRYFKKYFDSEDFWYELISYNDKFIKYCPKNIFETLLNDSYFVVNKLINRNIKYLKLTSIEKLLDKSLDYVNNFLSLDFKYLYIIPKYYIKKALNYNEYFREKIILTFMDIKNLEFYMKFKNQDEFLDELKKIDKKFKRNYEKLLKYLES